jgi:hypothetical protein
VARRDLTPPGCPSGQRSSAMERCNRWTAGYDKLESSRSSSIAAPPTDRGSISSGARARSRASPRWGASRPPWHARTSREGRFRGHRPRRAACSAPERVSIRRPETGQRLYRGQPSPAWASKLRPNEREEGDPGSMASTSRKPLAQREGLRLFHRSPIDLAGFRGHDVRRR